MRISLVLLSLVLSQATLGLYLKDRQAEVSLDELIKAKGKEYCGVATDRRLLTSNTNAQIIQANFGQVTPENSMKWESIQPSQGNFNWGDADYLVDWATENGKVIRGHTLVWHSQLAGWVNNINDPAQLTKVIQDHIAAVVGRYKGKIHHWDVVNEIFNEDGSLRDSVFSRVLGEDFVGIAFNAARQADPDAKLYINDYNLDNPNYAKTQAMANKVREWLAAGIPIDGIGTQAHLQAGGAGGLGGAIDVLANSGVAEVAITELDIAGASPDDYVTAFSGCMGNAKCVGVTIWGVADPDSWRAETTPLLFDYNYQPKPAYHAVAQSLQ
ncbi:hypothetical protein VTO42DRAFT_2141 [Malbranchea cinnamomea]